MDPGEVTCKSLGREVDDWAGWSYPCIIFEDVLRWDIAFHCHGLSWGVLYLHC